MNAVILCAGFATRMYPLTRNFPKPLLEVAGKPVLSYLMEQLCSIPDIRSVHIVSNHTFFDHFRQWQSQNKKNRLYEGVSVYIHNDGTVDNSKRRGAVGDLQLALEKIGTHGRVLVSGGDNIYRFSIRLLWESFINQGDHCIVALLEKELEKRRKTGVLEIGDDDRVIKLHEKPERPLSTWTCPPLYFFQPSILSALDSFLETPGNHDALGYFIDYLCQRQPVRALKQDPNSSRLDIGCLQTFKDADRMLRETPLQFEE
jgi:glucose-1-phosphate thymidylyltransferase